MIRYVLSILFLISMFCAVAQKHDEPKALPRDTNNRVVYVFREVLHKKSQKKLFAKTHTWMESDTAFQLTSSDIKSGIMMAKGTFYVPMPRYISPVTCQLEIRVSKDTVLYRFYDFYLVAIDYPLETVIEKNKDASREKTKQFMWFLTAGLHSQVVSWSQAFDANFAGWKR